MIKEPELWITKRCRSDNERWTSAAHNLMCINLNERDLDHYNTIIPNFELKSSYTVEKKTIERTYDVNGCPSDAIGDPLFCYSWPVGSGGYITVERTVLTLLRSTDQFEANRDILLGQIFARYNVRTERPMTLSYAFWNQSGELWLSGELECSNLACEKTSIEGSLFLPDDTYQQVTKLGGNFPDIFGRAWPC